MLAVVLHEIKGEGIILTAWRLRAEEDIVTTCSGWLCSRVFVCYVGGLGFIRAENLISPFHWGWIFTEK